MHQHPLLKEAQTINVPRRSIGVQQNIYTAPIHLQSTTFMQSVGVVHILVGSGHPSFGMGFPILSWIHQCQHVVAPQRHHEKTRDA